MVDSVGLPKKYSLTNTTNLEQYQQQITKASDYISPPSLGFLSSKIQAQTQTQFFKDYQVAFPHACAMSLETEVVALKDDELEIIGTVNNLSLYKLKDSKHSLYTLAYKTKLDYYDLDKTMWDQINVGIPKPNLESYVASNPLLFIKDYWNRWVAVGEYDIKFPGGCGKPVIYLYPSVPTTITVQFQTPIQLTTEIPIYGDAWQVLAEPNGSLTNLKPELTNCDKLKISQFGAEYAYSACLNNKYPYLYWAGNVLARTYPNLEKGWIVPQNQLRQFLNHRLTEIGLNSIETQDFMDYWLPELLKKSAPYYRISFLQTQDLNSMIPMIVKPTPDTVFRIFLDYQPLNAKPITEPQPQELNRLIRRGFTLVEWGGLKLPSTSQFIQLR